MTARISRLVKRLLAPQRPAIAPMSHTDLRDQAELHRRRAERDRRRDAHNARANPGCAR